MGRKDTRMWRKEVKKLRRKRIRKLKALKNSTSRDTLSPSSEDDDSAEERLRHAEEEVKWLERERQIQEEFKEKQRLLDEQAEQKRLQEEEAQRENQRLKAQAEEDAKLEQERLIKKVEHFLWLTTKTTVLYSVAEFDQFVDFLIGDVDSPPLPYVMPELDIPSNELEICKFFDQTGRCRFFNKCRQLHLKPHLSSTIVVPNFFSHLSLDEAEFNYENKEYLLLSEDSELKKEFRNFYDDVLPEFRKHGKVIQFKVCCNVERHLRGNVYIQYSSMREAIEAYRQLNGRFYDGKQLNMEFVRINSWKKAICGAFLRRICLKPRTCNYLHVFRNPTKEFVPADRDWEDFTPRHSRNVPNIDPSYSRSENSSMSPKIKGYDRDACSTIQSSSKNSETSSRSKNENTSHKRSLSPKRGESRSSNRLRLSTSRSHCPYRKEHRKKKKLKRKREALSDRRESDELKRKKDKREHKKHPKKSKRKHHHKSKHKSKRDKSKTENDCD